MKPEKYNLVEFPLYQNSKSKHMHCILKTFDSYAEAEDYRWSSEQYYDQTMKYCVLPESSSIERFVVVDFNCAF